MAQREPAQAILQEPVKKEEEEEPEYVTASIAKSAEYGLKEKDLDTLVCKRVPNPRNRRAAPMRLYIRAEVEELAKAAMLEWQADDAEELMAAKQITRSAKRSAAAEAAKQKISKWKPPGEDWGDSGTTLSSDLWTRVLHNLSVDIEPKGVRGVSVIARDLCNASLVCKELYVSAGQAFHRLAAHCPPVELEAEWTACFKGPMALKLPELKALARSVRLPKSLPKPSLALGLLRAWYLQRPTQVPPRVIMEVYQERRAGLYDGAELGHFYRACRSVPELARERLYSPFHARLACIKLGFTSQPLLMTAVLQAKRRQQEEARKREAERQAMLVVAEEARRRQALLARQAAAQGGPQQAAAKRETCVTCTRRAAAANCPFVRCGICCDGTNCKRHRKRS